MCTYLYCIVATIIDLTKLRILHLIKHHERPTLQLNGCFSAPVSSETYHSMLPQTDPLYMKVSP